MGLQMPFIYNGGKMNNLIQEVEETQEGFYVEELDQTFASFEEYLASIDEDAFNEIRSEEGNSVLNLVHEEMTDAYADYKRGYEEWLYVFEENYEATGRTRPSRKTDRTYYGASICNYNWGDTGEYTGFQPYELQTRRVTVKEWKKAPKPKQKKETATPVIKKIYAEQIDEHLKNMTAADFDPKTGALPYCKIVRGPIQHEWARKDFVSWRWDYTWDAEQTGVPEPKPAGALNTGFWTVIYKQYESKYDYDAGRLVDRSHLNEFSVYRTHRTNTEYAKKRNPSIAANEYTIQKQLN